MLLTDAKDVRVGTTAAKAVYAGTKQIWPAAAFKPSDLSGLKIWFDAADYLSGAWLNKAFGGAQATFVGSPNPVVGSTLNGKSVVRFKPNEGALRLASTGVATEWTTVYVGRIAGPTAGRVVTATYTPNNLLIGFWSGNQDVMYDNGFASPNTQTGWTTNWKMYSGDGTGSTSRLFSNGALLGTASTAAGWGGTFNLNGYSAAGAEETCDCEVAEVAQYNRKLSDAERQQVEGYLRTKWGLS
jgi:hypothetical protein